MFGTLLDKATGLLDRRLVTTALLPLLAFWAAVGALLAAPRWSTLATRWDDLDPAGRVLVAGGAVAGLLVSGWLVQIFLPGLIRWFEGYSPRWFWRLAGPAGRRVQRRRRDRLKPDDDADYARLYREYPPAAADLRPTRLGNALRAAEAYPGDPDRYGVDAVFFWPRLYPLLPDAMREALGSTRAGLEQMLVVSTLSGVFVGVSAVAGWSLGLRAVVWVPAGAGAAVLAVIAYRAAVASALGYGELVRAAFDTHRRDLLTALGLPLPTSLAAERALWTAIGQQLYRRGTGTGEAITFRADPA